VLQKAELGSEADSENNLEAPRDHIYIGLQLRSGCRGRSEI